LATLNNLVDHAELRALLQDMQEPELVGQQICQKGAINALEFLLQNGCTPAMVVKMLASLRECMLIVEETARSKGFERMFDPANTGFH
jgi:hypothetical protein